MFTGLHISYGYHLNPGEKSSCIMYEHVPVFTIQTLGQVKSRPAPYSSHCPRVHASRWFTCNLRSPVYNTGTWLLNHTGDPRPGRTGQYWSVSPVCGHTLTRPQYRGHQSSMVHVRWGKFKKMAHRCIRLILALSRRRMLNTDGWMKTLFRYLPLWLISSANFTCDAPTNTTDSHVWQPFPMKFANP